MSNKEELAHAANIAHQRTLEHPAKMAATLDHTWEARGHSDLISRSLADLANGDCKRLLVTTPPQVGKSSLVAEYFPFWWLARNPRHRIIVGSYGTSLANRRGRVVRKLVREHGWRYNLHMEPGAAGVAEWNLTTGGGMKSVGAGSAVTGSPADCVAGGTLIHTEHGEIPAARLARMQHPPRVAAWDHHRARFAWRRLQAVRALRVHSLREIATEAGRSLWCTHDHPVFVIGRGYVPAHTVRPGEEVITGADRPAPVQQRAFNPFPTEQPARSTMGPGQSTRPAMPHAYTTPTPPPERRKDWVRINRILPSRSTKTVYDFQVEQLSNFLADGILAHNCAIIDDPHKNRAEAESLVTRDKVWDWLSADITSRLAPGAPLALVLTLWHTDDAAARVLEQDGREEDGGLWRVIRLPALADRADDPLERAWGEPLPHPKVPENDQHTARQHWEMKRATSMVRDWHALYQCDPKPNEGALVSPELLRARRFTPPPAGVQRFGVAVDPAGGGRDLAGVIGGYLGDDTRLYITHDASRNGHSEQWAMEAALMAAENEADFIILEQNYGGDMARMAIDSAWDAAARMNRGEAGNFDEEEHVRRAAALEHMPPKPRIKLVVARKGKLLRAEPIAQQWYDDRMRTGKYLPELEGEWCIAAGQNVATGRGEVPIEHVRVGDQVMTRTGWRPVLWSGRTGTKETMAIHTSDGRTLRCTENHQVHTENRGWLPALEVEAGDIVSTCIQTPRSPSRDSTTTGLAMAIGRQTPYQAKKSHTGLFTEQSGSNATDPSQTDMTSCSSMETRTTSTPGTCTQSHVHGDPMGSAETPEGTRSTSTARTTTYAQMTTTSAAVVGHEQLGTTSCTVPCGPTTTDPSQTGCTSITRMETEATTTSATSKPCPCENTSVESTGTRSTELSLGPPKSAPLPAKLSGSAGNPNRSHAESAAAASTPQEPAPGTAPSPARVVSTTTSGKRAEPVYDLTVADAHEYYVNGLLVHNCTHQTTDPESPGRIDASVYLAYEMLPIPGSEAMVSVVSDLSRRQVQQQSARRAPAQPQMGTRIQRSPLRPQ